MMVAAEERDHGAMAASASTQRAISVLARRTTISAVAYVRYIRAFPQVDKFASMDAMNRRDRNSPATVRKRMFGRNAQFAFAFCFVLLLSPYRSALVKGLNAWRERKSGATYVCCIEFLTLRRIGRSRCTPAIGTAFELFCNCRMDISKQLSKRKFSKE